MSSFQIVNGYVCLNCSDVALAQKGVNPAHPPNSPSAISQGDGRNGPQGSSNTQSTPAVTFGGNLTQSLAAAPPAGSTGPATTTASQPPAQSGAQLNVYA